MRSHINLVIFVCFMSLSALSFAQQGTPSTADAAVSLPYIAEITGDNVYIRSGSGTNYYQCGKLNKGDKVKVISHQFSWSRIIPPAGSFSWISKRFVRLDPNVPTAGVVTGDSVRVWIGSEKYKPMHSTTNMVKLDKGEKITLLGQQQDDYYKIAPPAGEYRWVSTEFTKRLAASETPAVAAEPVVETPVKTERTAESKVLKDKNLEKYYILAERVKAQQGKPFDEQNYGELKKALSKIAANKKAGKAARYAQFTLKQIERCELAMEVDKTVKLQDTQLKQVQAGIDKAYAARLLEIEDLGRYVVVGKLKILTTYAAEPAKKRYQIIDDSGKILCLALPSGLAKQLDLSEYMNQRVGLIGTIHQHPQTSGAMVLFTEIIKLK